MKLLLSLLFIFTSVSSFSQKKLPVIKANSNEAKIFDGDNPVRGWNINPKPKIEIATTEKVITTRRVTFKTDVDSITFKMKPGQSKDFIVLLNGKDSCLTRIQAPTVKTYKNLKKEIHDTLKLTVNKENTNYVATVLNKTDSLQLNFDTGSTALTLMSDLLKNELNSKYELYGKEYDVQIGTRNYPVKVYDTERTGHETVGRFGWDLFDGLIVELNYDQNIMVVHSKLPKGIKKDVAYTKLPMKYFTGTFYVESTISQSGTDLKNWFMFDTGYQRTVMLDNDLLQEVSFPVEKMEVIKKIVMHGSKGNEVPVITSNLQLLKIGKYELKNVPAQLLTTNKPLYNANVHILGNEVLKRFNTVLDFQKNVVYMKPSSSYEAKYIEGKK